MEKEYEQALQATRLLSECWLSTGNKKIKELRNELEDYLVNTPDIKADEE